MPRKKAAPAAQDPADADPTLGIQQYELPKATGASSLSFSYVADRLPACLPVCLRACVCSDEIGQISRTTRNKAPKGRSARARQRVDHLYQLLERVGARHGRRSRTQDHHGSSRPRSRQTTRVGRHGRLVEIVEKGTQGCVLRICLLSSPGLTLFGQPSVLQQRRKRTGRVCQE